MKTKIHVNRNNIAQNRKYKKNMPVISAKTYKSNRYGHEVEITGPSRVVYRPDKPLPCGAVLWIETESSVIVFKRHRKSAGGIVDFVEVAEPESSD